MNDIATLATLATVLTESDPSGPNLEYDADFLALDRAQQGKPEQVMGDTVKPREEPDWSDVRERAQALLGRSRDLRVAVALTGALLRLEGIAGFATGLGLIARLLTMQWLTVHPRLDAEEKDDPTSRVNALVALAKPEGLLQALRETPAVRSKAVGRFGLRDFRIAAGKQPAPAGMSEPPTAVRIDAAFRDADPVELASTATAATEALAQVNTIDRLLVEKIGDRAPDFKPLLIDLAELKRTLEERLGAHGGASGVRSDAGDATISDGPAAGGAGGVGGANVGCREDVIRQLDLLCAYYARHEPSSPVPLLLQRARRLVSKDFLAIVRDLTPSGLSEAESIRGVVKDGE